MDKSQQFEGDSYPISERPTRRGRLRVFFGYAPGVGTTSAMLQAAHGQKANGTNVIVGCLETEWSPERQPSSLGLPYLPPREMTNDGERIREFDLDTALDRRPELVLLDDLAHTNAPGMRHAKRWQDVEELLDVGIDVFVTAHVQHVESLSNIVEQICGVSFHDTFPDHILDDANEVILIDFPPDELLERLEHGDLYVDLEGENSPKPILRRESLIALRELALRQVADRVHEEVQTAREDMSTSIPWPTREKIMVCVGSSPTSAKVVRAAKLLADPLHAEWVAVHVETGHPKNTTPRQHQQAIQNLQLAKSLGAEIAQLSGEDVATELILYAHQRNVNKIVIGKTAERAGWLFPRVALVDRLVRDSGTIDILMVRGIKEPVALDVGSTRKTFAWLNWLGTVLSLGAATLIAVIFEALAFSEPNLVMIYLLAIVFVGVRFGALPSVVASVAAVLLFDVLFTKPHFAITVHDTEYLVTFSVMLGVGLLASSLTSRIRRQAEVARRNERRAESLYQLNRRLAAISGKSQLVEHAEVAVSELFDAHAVVFLPNNKDAIRPVASQPASFAADASEISTAQWVYQHNQHAGLGTNTLPEAKALYLPLATPNSTVGVLAVQPEDANILQTPTARQLLDTCATQIALALERDMLTEIAQETRLQMESEKLRSSLLSAVSHDLRTPLAAIAGAGSSLAQSFDSLDSLTRQELLETICEESERLTRLVENLLNMTRLSGSRIKIDKQWHPVDEVVGSALSRLQRCLGDRAIDTKIPDDLPLGHFDAVLVEQVLVNLIENAARYSSPESSITIEAESLKEGIVLRVADRGFGLQEGDEERVFEMFYRGAQAKPDHRGTGLGLAICKAIVEAHHGSIGIQSREGGGTIVWLRFPSEGQPPQINVELSVGML